MMLTVWDVIAIMLACLVSRILWFCLEEVCRYYRYRNEQYHLERITETATWIASNLINDQNNPTQQPRFMGSIFSDPRKYTRSSKENTKHEPFTCTEKRDDTSSTPVTGKDEKVSYSPDAKEESTATATTMKRNPTIPYSRNRFSSPPTTASRYAPVAVQGFRTLAALAQAFLMDDSEDYEKESSLKHKTNTDLTLDDDDETNFNAHDYYDENFEDPIPKRNTETSSKDFRKRKHHHKHRKQHIQETTDACEEEHDDSIQNQSNKTVEDDRSFIVVEDYYQQSQQKL